MASQGPKKIDINGKEQELSPKLDALFSQIMSDGTFRSRFALGPRHVFGEHYFPGIENWYDAYVDYMEKINSPSKKSGPVTIPGSKVDDTIELACPSKSFSPSTSPSISPSTSPSTSPKSSTLHFSTTFLHEPNDRAMKKSRSGFFKRHLSLKRK